MATPLTLSVSQDLLEYSRFESNKNTIRVTITPTGSGTTGEPILVELVKARYNRDVSVATKTVTLGSGTSTSTTFFLPEILEATTLYPKVRRGKYFVRVTSVNDDSVTGITSDFLVSLITVDKMKKDWLHGVNGRAFDTLFVHSQPKLITGVTVQAVSKGHPQSWYILTYNYIDDGSSPIIQQLSWCGGPLVTVTESGTYTLRDDKTNNWIDVLVDFGALPTVSVSESLFIEQAVLDVDAIRSHIDEAISWVEDISLNIFLEPTRVITEMDVSAVSFASGTDIPTLANYDVDERVEPLTYYQASAGHWVNFRSPYKPIIKFEDLYGKYFNERVLNVDQTWIQFHERGGFVELIPIGQNLSSSYIGLFWISYLRGFIPLPNFWNFIAVFGYRELPKIVLELIAKKAAIDILTIAGQALRGGISSTGLSRDGISESISYMTGQYGIYSGAISQYQDWIDKNLTELEGSLFGPHMTVM